MSDKKKELSPMTLTSFGKVLVDGAADDTDYVDYHKGYSGKSKHWSGTYVKCAEKHPALKIGEYTVYGGACGSPVHSNLDIYVALDSGTAHDKQAYPWRGSRMFVYFPITDMAAPKDAEEFKLMIAWLAEQIKAGKSVHVGCIGGHGRTGTVLAALVKVLIGDEDAITYVRKNYCDKAVESSEQVKFLNKEFGIKVVEGAKHKWHSDYHEYPSKKYSGAVSRTTHALVKEFGDKVEEIKAIVIGGNIWGL